MFHKYKATLTSATNITSYVQNKIHIKHLHHMFIPKHSHVWLQIAQGNPDASRNLDSQSNLYFVGM